MGNRKIQSMPFVKSEGKYYNIIMVQYYPKHIHAGSLPSAYVMGAAIATLGLEEYISDRAVEIQKELGIGTTIWSLRFENGKFALEFYFYYREGYEQHRFEHLLKLLNPYMKHPFTNEKLEDGYNCISYDLGKERQIDGLNVYYAPFPASKPIVNGEKDSKWFFYPNVNAAISYYFRPTERQLEERNKYYLFTNCIRDLYEVMECIYSCCRDLFPNEDPIIANKFLSFPYMYDEDRNRFFHSYCLGKKENAMCVYFMGFTVNQFISFLKYHKYPEAYIHAIESEKENLNHLQFEVGIDFYLQNGEFVIKKVVHAGSF